MWGLDLREWRAWCSGGVRLLPGGEGFGKIGLGDSGQDVGDVEFEGMGAGELMRVGVAGFMELGKAGMERAGVMCWIEVL